MGKRDNTKNMDNLLSSVTAEIIGDELNQVLADNSVRVERILMELIRPDPVQARRVLPEALHMRFHNQRLSPTHILREWIQIVQVSARQQSRPFTNILELLNDNDEETEDSSKSFSEEDILKDLVNLAITIRDDGQVYPLTVVDLSQGVNRSYRIETGERRFWAQWLLRGFIEGYESDGLIDCIVLPAEKVSTFRQAKENTSRTGLNAISMARQAALLLLTIHGYPIPHEAVPADFYRKALELDLRSKKEYVKAVRAAMGGISIVHFNRYKALLRLSNEALELADRKHVDEFRLRPILSLPVEEQVEMIRHTLRFGLSGRQVEEICAARKDDLKTEGEIDIQPPKQSHIRKFMKAIKFLKQNDADDFINELLKEESSAEVAIARLDSVMSFLNQIKGRLSEK